MRIGLISDVHFGPTAHHNGKLRKLTGQARSLCEQFVRQMNHVHHPDLVINLGDVIEDESPERDAARYGEFVGLLNQLDCPVLHVAGNHDTVHLQPKQLAEMWGKPGPLYSSHHLDGFELLVLWSVEHEGTSIRVSEQQLAWVRERLAQAKAPVLVAMHHPASDMDLVGNRWFEHQPHICRVANRRELRRIFEESGKVAAVLNGHVHWNHFDWIASIPYITIQSLIENIDEDAPGRAARAWAICDLQPRRLHLSVEGEQPVRYQVELRPYSA